MTCHTDGDCCGPGSYCCANTGPHEHPELEPKFVIIPNSTWLVGVRHKGRVYVFGHNARFHQDVIERIELGFNF